MALQFRTKPVKQAKVESDFFDSVYVGGNSYAVSWAERQRLREEQERKERAANKMAALAYVNRMRNDLRLGSLDVLEPGLKGSAGACVVSASVKAGASKVHASTTSGSGRYSRLRWGIRLYNVNEPPPTQVARFISDFDMGYYPELIKKR